MVNWILRLLNGPDKAPDKIQDKVPDLSNDIVVKLEGRIQVYGNEIDFLSKFQPIFEDKNNSNIIIDLTKADFIYPTALLFLIALHETLKVSNKDFSVLITKGGVLHAYLDYTGFCEKFDIDEFPKDLETRPMNKKDVYRLDSTLEVSYGKKAVELVDFLKKHLSMSQLVESEVISSIEEVLRNIVQHSSCTDRFLIGQAYPTSNRIRFVFYDNGIGIKSHMTRNPYESMHKAFKDLVPKETFNKLQQEPANLAITEAARYQVSATNYTQNSGAGLDFLISDLCPITNGIVTIISEDGIVTWKNGNKEPIFTWSIPFKIKGTMVALTLDSVPDTIIKYSNE